MTTKAHKLLTDPNLHEPKGVSTATAGQVYRADGLGSGSWQTLVLPTGLFNVSYAVFPSSGTWTKPANLFLARILVIGGGGGLSTPGGTSSFGSYASATGGAVGPTGVGGIGTVGDLTMSGDKAGSYTSSGAALAGYHYGAVGRGGVDTGPSSCGGGGGAAIALVSSLTSTVTVTVGAGGIGGAILGGNNGIVVIEQYIST